MFLYLRKKKKRVHKIRRSVDAYNYTNEYTLFQNDFGGTEINTITNPIRKNSTRFTQFLRVTTELKNNPILCIDVRKKNHATK